MDRDDFEEEMNLLNDLKSKSVQAFSQLYNEYSPDLLIFAYTILGNGSGAMCRKKVDELFINLWEGNTFENIMPPIHHCLYSELRKICQAK